jgi:hypothetical protein
MRTPSGSAEHDAPLPAGRVLAEERALLRGGNADPGVADLSALSLSGGGIRSASFNLGLLQGLSRAGVLGRFDYLSTVSGGGYIGGWLTAWRARAHAAGEPDPVDGLLPPPSAGRAASAPLARLREFIRFLDPHLSVRSADVWTLGTIIVRNLVLNWLVLVPLLAAAVLVPRLYLGVLGLPSQPEIVSPATLAWWYRHDGVASALCFGAALIFAALELPSLGNRRHGQRAFLVLFLLPIVLGELVLSAHGYWAWRYAGGVSLTSSVLISMAVMPLPWILGGLIGGRWWRPLTWLAAMAAAGAGRAAIWSARHVIAGMAFHHPELFAAIEMPVTLALLFGQITLFVGLASRDMNDQDREWWGRAAAWILMVAAAWVVVGALAIYAPIVLAHSFSWAGVSETAGHLWLGVLTIGAGGLAARAGSGLGSLAPARAWIGRVLFVAAAPSLVVLLTLLLATADLRLLEAVHRLGLFHEIRNHPQGASLPEDLIALGLLLFLGFAASRLVSVDTFSLHGMYRQRLTRTFLGASREPGSRRPNPFTGFDEGDDLPMADTASAGRPLQVVNATLNTLANTSLAREERRAEAFTITALHAGSARVGYRPSAEYSGGVTLGQALTLSGAAVSPNMGAASRPALTFLLTLFNARLGAWLGNPGPAGARVWRQPTDAYGASPLIGELLGRTRDESPFVYLSDGGHFENLGLYEMVRRGCRFIVVSDAGCDPGYRFDDLANAVRLVRLDFGVEIDFPGGLGIAPADGRCPGRWALGRIRYSAADPTASDGVLLYVKAALCGDEPIDVRNYAAAHEAFPHQSTANQWFDPAQFESYRMLGLHTIATLTGDARVGSVAELCARGAAAPRRAAAAG